MCDPVNSKYRQWTISFLEISDKSLSVRKHERAAGSYLKFRLELIEAGPKLQDETTELGAMRNIFIFEQWAAESQQSTQLWALHQSYTLDKIDNFSSTQGDSKKYDDKPDRSLQ